MTKDEQFSINKCPNCNGYGTFGYGKHLCVTCKGRGVIIIDNITGKIIDDYEGGKNDLETANPGENSST